MLYVECSRIGTNLSIADRHFELNAQDGPIAYKAEWWTIVSISSFTLYYDDLFGLFEYR
jgi:hypothetical protein